ncbi:MAG: CRISPR system precrRNA processing endoribonuclease RAMP protein Cas6 [Anaerolineae bacterium]|nr:CRISPR system precrRNA processing endoribonuclease RAMP protein Cas6 [Anaerolineae bacterium]
MYSLVLTLRVRAPCVLPPMLGRAAHSALLRAMAERDAALAEKLHDDNAPRPFTCSSLMGARINGTLTPDVPYTLRYTTLTADIRLDELWAADRHSTLELEGVLFDVVAATTDANVHPWAARTTFEELSARWLLARETPHTRITLHLASPTAFKQGGKAQLFPLPDLVFGSLLDKWNTFAPIALPDETRRFAAECLAVSRFDLETHAAPFKSDGALKSGAVGKITYVALNHDRYWLSIINLLADFALFAGVGMSTALGMGQARRILDSKLQMAD